MAATSLILAAVVQFFLADQDGCTTPESFYNTSCGLPGDFWYGYFLPNPCINATSTIAAKLWPGEQCSPCKAYQVIRVSFYQIVSLKNTKRAPPPVCQSGYVLQHNSIPDNGFNYFTFLQRSRLIFCPPKLQPCQRIPVRQWPQLPPANFARLQIPQCLPGKQLQHLHPHWPRRQLLLQTPHQHQLNLHHLLTQSPQQSLRELLELSFAPSLH